MHFFDLFFPKHCIGCGKWGMYICFVCQQSIKPLLVLKCPVCEKPAIDGMTHPKCQSKHSLDGLTSFYQYDGVIKKAITHIKYRYTFDIVNDLIGIIPASSFSIFSHLRTKAHEQRTYSMIPIPLHTTRYNHRGFNQAEIIAKALEKRLNVSVQSRLLYRVKNTLPQVQMKDRNKRLANMKNVFSVSCSLSHVPFTSNHTSYLLPPHSGCFIIDDVYTTGATLRSAASVLKHHGAEYVWGITIAQ